MNMDILVRRVLLENEEEVVQLDVEEGRVLFM